MLYEGIDVIGMDVPISLTYMRESKHAEPGTQSPLCPWPWKTLWGNILYLAPPHELWKLKHQGVPPYSLNQVTENLAYLLVKPGNHPDIKTLRLLKWRPVYTKYHWQVYALPFCYPVSKAAFKKAPNPSSTESKKNTTTIKCFVQSK